MRLGIVNRVIRFLFAPLSIFSILTLLYYRPEFKDVNKLCQERINCYAHCVNDNFPDLSCKQVDVSLEFNGNMYDQFYYYPKKDSVHYRRCLALLDGNDNMPYAEDEPERQWRTHTCFNSCKRPADCLLGFDDDFRQECTKNTRDQGLICVMPTTKCENYIMGTELCLDKEKTICLDFSFIFLAVFIGNLLQLVFETSMLYSMEVTFKPTNLDKLQDPEKYQDEVSQDQNPDQKKELDCGKVLMKCWGEMLFIACYLIVIGSFVIGVTYLIQYGRPLSIMVEFFIAWAIDQSKAIPVQSVIYWVVIRRFGTYENVNLQEWDDEQIADRGTQMSLFFLMRKTLANFLEKRLVSRFILGMVILLCVVIFSELSLTQQIESSPQLTNFYYILNYALLAFFVLEIGVKLFAYGHLFLMEYINLFDSTIVIISFIMQVLNLKAKVLGILRVLRLIKVIIEMKKVADAKKEQTEMIKEQKRQGSQMASYVERVLEYFERLAINKDIPKHLQEDLQWAIDVISGNRLYAGGFEGFKISEDKLEVKAWTDLIALKCLPVNKLEYERLKQFEVNEVQNKNDHNVKITMKKSSDPQGSSNTNLKKKGDSGTNQQQNPDESRMNLLNQSMKIDSNSLNPVTPSSKLQLPGFSKQKTNNIAGTLDLQVLETDEDREFLMLTDLIDLERSYLDSAVEKFDETMFDSFTYCQIIGNHSLQYITFKIFQMYNFISHFNISLERLANFTLEIQNGYFQDNPYHNMIHIVDSLQAMHYLMNVGNLKRYLKKHDIMAVFTANLIHDYEHPGYSNQFVIRTKHPLAIRYSDSAVLENHHLAAAFSIMLTNEDNNIFENLPIDTYQEVRKIIIRCVLNTDLSKHFTLMTELKTKLGNNFPTDSLDDRILIQSVTIRICDQFKVVRGTTIFFKWMDAMFEEFFKQGDMEKVLDLPISKFMDRENTNKEKAFSNYLNVVCRPLLTTYLILINDDEVYGAMVREGIDKNKKNLEQRIDGDSGK